MPGAGCAGWDLSRRGPCRAGAVPRRGPVSGEDAVSGEGPGTGDLFGPNLGAQAPTGPCRVGAAASGERRARTHSRGAGRRAPGAGASHRGAQAAPAVCVGRTRRCRASGSGLSADREPAPHAGAFPLGAQAAPADPRRVSAPVSGQHQRRAGPGARAYPTWAPKLRRPIRPGRARRSRASDSGSAPTATGVPRRCIQLGRPSCAGRVRREDEAVSGERLRIQRRPRPVSRAGAHPTWAPKLRRPIRPGRARRLGRAAQDSAPTATGVPRRCSSNLGA